VRNYTEQTVVGGKEEDVKGWTDNRRKKKKT
jgi:hypothetical protein